MFPCPLLCMQEKLVFGGDVEYPVFIAGRISLGSFVWKEGGSSLASLGLWPPLSGQWGRGGHPPARICKGVSPSLWIASKGRGKALAPCSPAAPFHACVWRGEGQQEFQEEKHHPQGRGRASGGALLILPSPFPGGGGLLNGRGKACLAI